MESENDNRLGYGKAILTIILSFVLYYIITRSRRIEKMLKGLPGPTRLPILGMTLEVLRPNYELCDVILGWYKKYGSLFVVWIGDFPVVALCGAKEVEAVLSSSTQIEKSREYDLLFKWLGFGLLTAKPKLWHARRKLLTPAFHFKILEEFSIIFNEQANIFVKILKEIPSGTKLDIFPYITRCALDIICESAMGRKLNAQSKNEEIEYVKAVYGYGDILIKKVARPWLQIPVISKVFGYTAMEDEYVRVLHEFTNSVIAEKRQSRKEKRNFVEAESEDCFRKKRKAFLDLLLDLADEGNGQSLSDKDIREETDTFMFEGHDTTAANLAWTIWNLARHPEHQNRLYEELQGIFGNEINKELTHADMSQMKFLEACIKESLRLYPSVPFYIRTLSEDLQIGSHVLPKGIGVAVADFLLHRDPKVFPDPEAFIPDRFYSESTTQRHPFAYVPFSAGPRNCIGQKFALLEEKVILAKLFLNFRLETTKTIEDIKMVPDLILRPLNGIEVTLFPRDAFAD